MVAVNKMNKLCTNHWLPSTIRCFSDDAKSSDEDKEPSIVKKRVAQSQYVPISEATATIILDVEEEREKLKSGGPYFNNRHDDHQYDVFEGLNADRKFHLERQLHTTTSLKLNFSSISNRQVECVAFLKLKIWWKC